MAFWQKKHCKTQNLDKQHGKTWHVGKIMAFDENPDFHDFHDYLLSLLIAMTSSTQNDSDQT